MFDPDEVPTRLRDVAIRELLPEILHDLNNECAVLEGVSALLGVGAGDPAKVAERAATIAGASQRCERISWMASSIGALLGAPVAPGLRDDALPTLFEVALSALHRRGVIVHQGLPANAVLRDPLGAAALAAGLAGFVPASAKEVKLQSLEVDGSAWSFEVRGGHPEPEGAEILEFLRRALDLEIRTEPLQGGVGIRLNVTTGATTGVF